MYNFNDICRVNGILYGILFLFISMVFFLFLYFAGEAFGGIFTVWDIYREKGLSDAFSAIEPWEYISAGGFLLFLILALWSMFGGNMYFVERSLSKLGYSIDEVRDDVDYSEKLDKFYIGDKFLVTAAASNVHVVRLSDIDSVCERTEYQKLDWNFIPIITSKLYFIDITPQWGKKFEIRCKNRAKADEVIEYLKLRRERDGYYFEISVKEPKSLLKRATGFVKGLFK